LHNGILPLGRKDEVNILITIRDGLLLYSYIFEFLTSSIVDWIRKSRDSLLGDTDENYDNPYIK
jgi:hypothetical protein